LPKLSLADATPEAAQALLQKSLRKLGIPAGFGLRIQSHDVDAQGGQLVRVQLTDERSGTPQPLGNHGVLTFRSDGTLRDYHGPVPQGLTGEQLAGLVDQGKKARLDQHGAAMSVVANGTWGFTVKSYAHTGTSSEGGLLSGLNRVQEFSLDSPGGRTLEGKAHSDSCGLEKRSRETLPDGAHILSAAELLGEGA